MKRVILLACMALVMPLLLAAQEGKQDLTLKKAVEYALEYNKQLQVSRQNIDLYKQKIRESVSQGLPQVNGTVDYSTNFGYSMDLMGASMKLKDQMNARLTVNQLIFSGQWILGIQTSKIAEQIAAHNVDISELDVKESIMNTYYMVLVYERIRDILKDNVKNMEDVHTHTQNMYNVGTVEVTDVDQIRINVGKLKNSLLTIERNIEVSYNLLRLQLGMEAGTALTLTEPLDTFLGQDNYMALSVKQFEIDNNAEFQLMNSQAELSKKMLGLERWAYAPTISGTYGYNHKIMKSDFDMSPKHSAGITMTVPIFSGLQRKSKVEQAKIELEQTSINKSLLEDQLRLNDSQYKFELKNATENYLLQNDNVEVARRVLQNIQHKYEQGAVSSLDLTQANTNYLQAESDYTEACLTLLQAKTKIERLYNIFPY